MRHQPRGGEPRGIECRDRVEIEHRRVGRDVAFAPEAVQPRDLAQPGPVAAGQRLIEEGREVGAVVLQVTARGRGGPHRVQRDGPHPVVADQPVDGRI